MRAMNMQNNHHHHHHRRRRRRRLCVHLQRWPADDITMFKVLRSVKNFGE